VAADHALLLVVGEPPERFEHLDRPDDEERAAHHPAALAAGDPHVAVEVARPARDRGAVAIPGWCAP
jgi:hypothetical protein